MIVNFWKHEASLQFVKTAECSFSADTQLKLRLEKYLSCSSLLVFAQSVFLGLVVLGASASVTIKWCVYGNTITPSVSLLSFFGVCLCEKTAL